jgi:hypothetical protein
MSLGMEADNMAVIFSNSPGVATAIVDPNVIPVTFGIGGWGNAAVRNAIIRGVAIKSGGNYQLNYTLRNFTYVYVFGELAGDFIVTGLTFTGTCGGSNFNGISGVINYYGNFGISYYGNPVPIQIGAYGFWGFLVSIETGIHDPDSQLGKFTLVFKTLPS